MMQAIQESWNNWTEGLLHRQSMGLYRRVVYVFVCCFTLLQWPAANEFWSENAAHAPYFFEGNSLLQSLNTLSHQAYTSYYPLFIGLMITAVIWSFFSKRQFLPALIIYFCYSNFYFRNMLLQNGSGDLLHLQLFFLLLMDETAESRIGKFFPALSIALTNTAFLAAQLQLILVYVVSGIYKLQGTHWIDGTAMSYVFLNPTYSLPWLQQMVHHLPLLLKVLTWLILLFQLLFPLLIWNKQLKPFLLAFGIAMHLGIAFLMGIPDFGLLMLVMYLLFTGENWAARMNERFFFWAKK